MNRPVIGIAGCGALGSIFAARFTTAGMDIRVFDSDNSVINAITNNGLQITSADGKVSSYHITVSSDPSILSTCDLIFIFVKTYNLESCLDAITRYLKSDAVLVSLQNGIGNDEILGRYVNPKNIIFGTTAMGATLLGPGSARTGGIGPTVIGGVNKSNVEKAHSVLEAGGFDVTVTDNPAQAVWEKAIINSAINPLGAIFQVPNGMLVRNDDMLALQKELVAEACTVARSFGMQVDTQSMIEKTRTVCERTSTNLCSMLQDMGGSEKKTSNCCSSDNYSAKSTKTEIDSINGAIVREGARNGILCPVHSVIIHIIHGLENRGIW